MNSEEDIQKQIDRLQKYKRAYEDRLASLQTDERELTVQWVDRERLHEQVVEIQGRVDFYAKRIRAAEIEFHNTPKPVELKRPAFVPKVTDNSRRIALASLAGVGTYLLCFLSAVGMGMSSGRQKTVSDVVVEDDSEAVVADDNAESGDNDIF